jgi:hypothetical protein
VNGMARTIGRKETSVQKQSILEDYVDLLSASTLPRGSQIRLSLPDLDPSRARVVETALNKSLRECGCRLSAAFLCLGVSVALIVDVITWNRFSRHLISTLIAELALIFLWSAVGRGLGLVLARHKFKRDISALCAELQL